MKPVDLMAPLSPNLTMLRLVGMWPKNLYKPDLYSIYSLFAVIFFVYGHNITLAINTFYIFDDVILFTDSVFILAIAMLPIPKSYFLMKNVRSLKRLIESLECERFQPKNFKQVGLVRKSLKNWKRVYVMFMVLAAGNIFFLFTYPLFNGSQRNYRLPMLAWYPFDTKSSPQYELTYCYQFASVTFICMINVQFDSLVSALMMFVGVQCDLLCDNLKDADDPGSLLICIKHHKEILEFTNISNNFFSFPVLAQFFASAVSLGLTLFEMSVMVPFSSDFFAFFSYELAILQELFLYCWFGNEVEHKSRNIPLAAYQLDWTDAPTKFKKDLSFFIAKSQNSVKISASNIFYLSLDTFMRILRSSWSYFAVLQQVSSKK